MKVKLTTLDDGAIAVEMIGVGGGVAGTPNMVIVQPTGSFGPWKHKRLRKMGDGVHELLTKEEKALLKDF